MKVLLVNPKNHYDAGEEGNWFAFPMSLLYLAAGLNEEVKIADLNYDGDIETIIGEFQPMVVGITGWLTNWASTLETIRVAKQFDATIVVGGPYASVAPQTYIDSGADYVITGEARKSFADFLKNINSPSTIIEGEVGELPRIEDILDAYKKHFPPSVMKRYMEGGRARGFMITASFGCPYRCTFCSANYLGKYQERALFDVERELDFLISEYGIGLVYFADATLTLNKARTLKLCQIMKENSLSWYGETRIDALDQELIEAMADSGCVEVLVGVESFDQNRLKATNKGITAEKSAQITRWLVEKGIETVGFVLIGLPGQDEEELDGLIDKIRHLPYRVMPNILIPIPGTPIWNEAERILGELDPKTLLEKAEQYCLTDRAYPVVNLTKVSDQKLAQIVEEINILNGRK